MRLLVDFILVIAIGSIFSLLAYNDGYKQGQTDYLQGKIKYQMKQKTVIEFQKIPQP